jgi:putative glutamine transport system substrate-binding protein
MFAFIGCNDSPDKSLQVKAIRKRGILCVGTQLDIPRLSYLNRETNELEGFEIDLARSIAEAILDNREAVAFTGATPQLRGPLLDNGDVDMIIGTYTITEERKKHYNFTFPYYADEVGLLVRKDSGLTGLADMHGKICGIVKKSTIQEASTKAAKQLGVELRYAEFSSYPEIMDALLIGMVDVFSTNRSILWGYVNEDTLLLAESFDPRVYGIATKLENDQLAAYLDTLVIRMHQDGTLAALVNKWGL